MGKTEYIERPKDGDYCKLCQAIIYDENGEIMCDKCVIRCKHSGIKKEGDYLIRK